MSSCSSLQKWLVGSLSEGSRWGSRGQSGCVGFQGAFGEQKTWEPQVLGGGARGDCREQAGGRGDGLGPVSCWAWGGQQGSCRKSPLLLRPTSDCQKPLGTKSQMILKLVPPVPQVTSDLVLPAAYALRW